MAPIRRVIAHAHVKTDKIDAGTLASLYAARPPPTPSAALVEEIVVPPANIDGGGGDRPCVNISF